jgi:hypothetical protein
MARRIDWKPTGKCSHCGINLYAETGNQPHKIAMPCNVSGCPFETPEQQQKLRLEDFKIKPAGQGYTYYE